jgi:hypothetical protein
MERPMNAADTADLHEFRWTPQPAAAGLVSDLLDDFRSRLPWVDQLGRRMTVETGTRLIDWVDHFVVPDEDGLESRLQAAGFAPLETNRADIWRHPGGLFPNVVVMVGERSLTVKVESAADFLFAQRPHEPILEGDPLNSVRRARATAAGDAECWAIERHGSRELLVDDDGIAAADPAAVLFHAEQLMLRRRCFAKAEEGFAEAERLIAAAATELGTARACDLFFAAERAYWQSRNRAARIQKARQDALGLGWGNHDHHTYRSSRECFASLIASLERMGFQCRERFYAGQTAGWGAQVLEQADCGIVIFADVDLSPEEVSGDFAHDPLAEKDQLGTVGLWCRLHGEAFLEAGMHHLECQFDFDAARDQLHEAGIETMKPFTDLPYLRQAFTKGEFWPVRSERIDALLQSGQITAENAGKFRTAGALGSHLEILQRDDGYKGFNQTGIDEIILKTDPRGTVGA